MTKGRYEVEVGVMGNRYYSVVAQSFSEASDLGYAEAQADPNLSQDWKNSAEVEDINLCDNIDSELNESSEIVNSSYLVQVGVMESRHYYDVVAESYEEALELGYAEAQADPNLSQYWKDHAVVGEIEFLEYIDSELDASKRN